MPILLIERRLEGKPAKSSAGPKQGSQRREYFSLEGQLEARISIFDPGGITGQTPIPVGCPSPSK